MYIYTPGAWNIQFFNVERFVGVLLGVKYHLYNYGWPLPEAFRCLEIFRSFPFVKIWNHHHSINHVAMNFTRPSVSRYYRYFIKLPNPKLTNKILWRKKTPFDLQKNIEHQVPSYKEMVSMNFPPLQTCGENLVNCEQVFFHQVPGAHNFPKQIDSEWNFPENSWLEDNFISFWGFGFLAGAIVCWFFGSVGDEKTIQLYGAIGRYTP